MNAASSKTTDSNGSARHTWSARKNSRKEQGHKAGAERHEGTEQKTLGEGMVEKLDLHSDDMCIPRARETAPTIRTVARLSKSRLNRSSGKHNTANSHLHKDNAKAH